MIPICPPALLYLTFTLIQIAFDVMNENYTDGMTKVLILIPVTFLLNYMCNSGYQTVSWFFVLIPLLFMTVVIGLMFYIFGTQVTDNNANYTCNKYPNNITVDDDGNIIINDPLYDYVHQPAYYKYPNIIIPKSVNRCTGNNQPINTHPPSGYSSDPSYKS